MSPAWPSVPCCQKLLLVAKSSFKHRWGYGDSQYLPGGTPQRNTWINSLVLSEGTRGITACSTKQDSPGTRAPVSGTDQLLPRQAWSRCRGSGLKGFCNQLHWIPVSHGATSYHKLTKKGCSRPCIICSSLKTFLTSLRSTHFCLFTYFMAYIFLVSVFCTTHT